MPAPTTVDEFLELVRKSGVLEERKLDAYLEKLRAATALPAEPAKLAGLLVRDGILTHFQAEQFLLGKWRRFTIGKYRVLERLGAGGMGSVFLCEHRFMRRRVAVKVLPTAKADDPSAKERFYREARAVAALDHPNIVRAYDIDQDDKLHFLVMEYVDGASLQEIIKRSGPMDVLRACHYVRQAALGLQHAHESAGIVHRDIKPGNILVDRHGTVKVLDMGLARFFHDEEDILTKKYDENVLGTADYLAPEQALDSHTVDIRADIYSLGATFYFCLTGRTPFTEGTVAQKLIWHQTRQPKPIRQIRPEVPEAIAAIVEKMMAKDPAQRYQTPLEVVEALTPFTRTPIPPPPEAEMPHLSLAATGGSAPEPGAAPTPGPISPAPRPNRPSSAASRSVSSSPTQPSSKPPATAPSAPPREPRALAAPAVTAAAPTAAGAAVAVPVIEPAVAEEGAPWEQFGPDTDDPIARSDTAPRPAAAPASPRDTPTARAEPQGLAPWWWVVVLVVALLLLLGGTGLAVWWVVSRGGQPADRGDAPPAPAALHVSQTAPDACRTVGEALRRARAGGRIALHDPVVREDLWLDGKSWKLPPNITVGPAEELKEPVRWLLPEKSKANQVLVLSNVDGLTLRGITFDGEQRAQDALSLTGRNPGLVLEDVTVTGFRRSGVLITNCTGGMGRPVSLVRLRAVTQTDAQIAVLFDLNRNVRDPNINQFISFHDCRVEGPSKTPLQHAPDIVKDVQLPDWPRR